MACAAVASRPSSAGAIPRAEDTDMTDLTAALDTLLAQRHSCRAFMPRPVERATIEAILRTAQRAASWCNSQAWQLSITSGAATDRLRAKLVAAQLSGHPGGNHSPFPPQSTGAYPC